MVRGRVLLIGRGAVQDALPHVLPELEYLETAQNAAGTATMTADTNFDSVIADLSDWGVWQQQTVRNLRMSCPNVPLIVAARDSTDAAGVGAGPFVSVRIPVDPEVLRQVVLHAVEKHRLVKENQALALQLKEISGPAGKNSREHSAPAASIASAGISCLVGKSAAMMRIRKLVQEVAPTAMTVLVTGESGTGKEVVARAIHAASPRKDKGSLVKINCPAVPEMLLESELFGHEPGAFTGALERKPGRLELAVGGTVFLDEIGDIPPGVQAKLLQVLEHRQCNRLGGTDTLKLDVRFVAATNISLLDQLKTGKFRKDLYFRLNQYAIRIPPLRERIEDIPVLAEHFLAKFAPLYGHKRLRLSDKTIAALMRHPWPGNVRELESVLQRYALTGREESALPVAVADGPGPERFSGTYKQCEKNLIVSTLVANRWNRRLAAEALGMSYNTLRRRIAQYGLDAGAQSPSPRAASALIPGEFP